MTTAPSDMDPFPDRVRCSFDAGFQSDAARSGDWLDDFAECEKAAYHEAGHAVIAYGLGLGCVRVELAEQVEYRDGFRAGAYGGCFYINDCSARRIGTSRKSGAVDHWIERAAVYTCAGPAAERKCDVASGRTPRAFGGGADDAAYIRALVWSLSRAAATTFLERAWARAQELLENPNAWAAIEELADHLLNDHQPDFDQSLAGLQMETTAVAGARARQILRAAGLTPGSLWRPS